MASVEENRRYWEEIYDWSHAGEEWSRGWGGTEALWEASIKPRIQRFLPAGTILEIAPGHGRFTPHLLEQCHSYTGVDLSPTCVAVCQANYPTAAFHVNDGATLPMIASSSVDFIFSFFSLIHADRPTLQSYLHEFARVLKPEGGGFVHHSNLADHARYFANIGRLPKLLQRALYQAGLIDLPQWREPTVCAEVFAQCAREAGLALLCQETVNFGSRRTIDAFSSFVRADGPWQARHYLWPHQQFMHEAMRIRLKSKNQSATLPAKAYGPLERR